MLLFLIAFPGVFWTTLYFICAYPFPRYLDIVSFLFTGKVFSNSTSHLPHPLSDILELIVCLVLRSPSCVATLLALLVSVVSSSALIFLQLFL